MRNLLVACSLVVLLAGSACTDSRNGGSVQRQGPAATAQSAAGAPSSSATPATTTIIFSHRPGDEGWASTTPSANRSPQQAQTASPGTPANTASAPAPAYVDGTPLAGTFGSLLLGPSVARTHNLLMMSVDAYNRRDVDGVLATLDDNFQYGDCNPVTEQYRQIGKHSDDKAQLASWLRERFTDGEHFAVVGEAIGTPYGTPPSDPRVSGLSLLRTSAALARAGKQPVHVNPKIIVNATGDKFTTVALDNPWPANPKICASAAMSATTTPAP